MTASFPVSERNKVRRAVGLVVDDIGDVAEHGGVQHRIDAVLVVARLDEVMSENYRKTYAT